MNIPMILAGGGAGHLKGGRHIRFKSMPLANLHLTLLDQFGVHWDQIGDSTGRSRARILSVEVRQPLHRCAGFAVAPGARASVGSIVRAHRPAAGEPRLDSRPSRTGTRPVRALLKQRAT